MPDCYNMYAYNISSGQRTFQVRVCADTVFYRQVPGAYNNSANLIAVTNGVETIVNGTTFQYWSTLEAGRAIEVLPNSECPNCFPSVKKYDCLNGGCIQHTVYNSPGLFTTLAECQAACGSASNNNCKPPNICVSPDYCPPGMVCLTLAELSTIDGLSSELKSKNCS
jgi:hypothetical protein